MNATCDPFRVTINQGDRNMGGRFGKYGDVKRKARIRQSILFKRDVERVRQTSRRLKKDKRFKIQPPGKPKVSIEIRPDVSPQQSGEETGHSPVKKSD